MPSSVSQAPLVQPSLDKVNSALEGEWIHLVWRVQPNAALWHSFTSTELTVKFHADHQKGTPKCRTALGRTALTSISTLRIGHLQVSVPGKKA